jgi:hypothetical protein
MEPAVAAVVLVRLVQEQMAQMLLAVKAAME